MLSGHSFNALLKTPEEYRRASNSAGHHRPAETAGHYFVPLPAVQPEKHAASRSSDTCAMCWDREMISFEALLWLLGRAAADVCDALSLTDRPSRWLRQTQRGRRPQYAGAAWAELHLPAAGNLAAGDPAGLLAVVAHIAEHAPDFEGSLDELISLLHRVAVARWCRRPSTIVGAMPNGSHSWRRR